MLSCQDRNFHYKDKMVSWLCCLIWKDLYIQMGLYLQKIFIRKQRCHLIHCYLDPYLMNEFFLSDLILKYFYIDIAWALKCLKSWATQLFIEQLIQADNHENLKLCATCSLWGPVDSQHKRVIMHVQPVYHRKLDLTYSCHPQQWALVHLFSWKPPASQFPIGSRSVTVYFYWSVKERGI